MKAAHLLARRAKAMDTVRYRLSSHSFISVGTNYCVFLDAVRDRFLAINREQFAALGPWLDGWIGAATDCGSDSCLSPRARKLAADLCRLGILTTAQHHGKPVRTQTIVAAATNAVPHLHRVGASERLSHGANFLMALVRTRRQFKTDMFRSLLYDVSGGHARPDPVQMRQLEHETFLVSVFEGWRAYYSRSYVCLFDSVCLLNFLARYGFFPSLVFGVIAEPFQAHCWLQEGDLVLNDTVERVTAYAPIMRV